jgi:predicted kinase
MTQMFVAVGGLPASGKSTLARQLAPALSLPLLRALPAPIVEVRCRGPVAVAQQRYRARMPTRRTGDVQAQRPDRELWAAVHREPLGVGPVVRVPTDRPVDIAAVVAEVMAHGRRLTEAAEHRGVSDLA